MAKKEDFDEKRTHFLTFIGKEVKLFVFIHYINSGITVPNLRSDCICSKYFNTGTNINCEDFEELHI